VNSGLFSVATPAVNTASARFPAPPAAVKPKPKKKK